MTGTLAAAQSVTQSPGLSGTAWFFIIIAAIAGAVIRWLAPIVIFFIYFVMHTSTSPHISHPETLLWFAVLVVGGFIGWQLGGRMMLRHVGEREFRNRLGFAKGISGIWASWFGDGE
jgi:hypothetical protein